MYSKDFSNDDEVLELLSKVQLGDNEAWEKLYDYFRYYVKSIANRLLVGFEKKNFIEEDLCQAGWTGFIKAIKNYKSCQSKFITYATYYIEGEMKKERELLVNSLGLTENPGKPDYKIEYYEAAKEEQDDSLMLEIFRAVSSKGNDLACDAVPVEEKYPAEGRAIQILEILKLLTDENHSLTKEEIKNLLRLYRAAKYGKLYKPDADNTITGTIKQLIMELDPQKYTGENDRDYGIFYEGYKEDRFRKNENTKNGKAKPLTGFSYNHIFSKEELDTLIEQVCFSKIISVDEKSIIIEKLISTASVYYRSPFFDGEGLRFNPKAVHGRFDSRRVNEKLEFINNISILQDALNNLAQVSFRFNRYSMAGELVATSDYVHELSPYHLVVYHDNYYVIGLKKDDKRIWHYRVDLMTDIEIMRDDEGKIKPIELTSFEGLPISNVSWDPEKYMSEHLYMAYDEPCEIRIKIKNTDYTILHDWFGKHYTKTNESVQEGYDIVVVNTSPSMIVHWALQYAQRVEVLDEDIRKKIREELVKLGQKYSTM